MSRVIKCNCTRKVNKTTNLNLLLNCVFKAFIDMSLFSLNWESTLSTSQDQWLLFILKWKGYISCVCALCVCIVCVHGVAYVQQLQDNLWADDLEAFVHCVGPGIEWLLWCLLANTFIHKAGSPAPVGFYIYPYFKYSLQDNKRIVENTFGRSFTNKFNLANPNLYSSFSRFRRDLGKNQLLCQCLSYHWFQILKNVFAIASCFYNSLNVVLKLIFQDQIQLSFIKKEGMLSLLCNCNRFLFLVL